MEGSIVGARIRQRRKELGIAQADLARRIEVSASYLNLVEWNKRRAPPQLLGRIAENLGVEVEALDSANEKRMRDVLAEIAHMPALGQAAAETDRISELIGRFPGWSRAIVTLARSEQEAQSRASALSDRLSNDPFLGEVVHRMLTRIASMRSATDILEEYSDLSEEERDRFTRIIVSESRTLSEIGEGLAGYLDKAEDTDRVMTPLDEVESLFESRGNHFAEIEMAASEAAEAETPISRFRAEEIFETYLSPAVEAIVESEPQITTAPAAKRARRALHEYAIAAAMLPMEVFSRSAAEFRYDIEALSQFHGIPVGTICHRLTALPPSDQTPKFGYFRANAAGTIIEMLGISGLAIPRYGAICPLWALFRAQQAPETVIRQRALFPSGERFVFVARARHVGPTGFGKPRHCVTDLLAMSETDARLTVYEPDRSSIVEEVGPSCRLCPRKQCMHRVDDPLAG